jgi:hypothetical protein
MYAMTVLPVLSLTLATLRFEELGFFGAMVNTCEQTPLRCGELLSNGDFDKSDFLSFGGLRRML